MPELNKVLIAGRLTENPTLKYTTDGIAVANLKLAVNHYAKDKQEPEASYFDVVAFGKVAEFIGESTKKADQILVDGRLRQVKYTTKVGGEEKTRSRVEIIANSIFPINVHTGAGTDDKGTIDY